jgi:predicted transposase/invertase (TIGR01784 family)
VLPPSLDSLVDAIEWDTLALEPGSFVDASLSKSHSDLLFSLQVGGRKLLLYVLLEHQSRVDRRMSYRVLRYVTRIWDRHLEHVGEPLPLVIAIVVSHAPGGWTAPVRLHDLIMPAPASIDGVEALVPGFEILVEDLAHLSNEDLQDLALAAFPKLVLWALSGRPRRRKVGTQPRLLGRNLRRGTRRPIRHRGRGPSLSLLRVRLRRASLR